MTLKNVLLVTETYRPEINGVATTLGNWVDGMLAMGIKVSVVRPKQSKTDQPSIDTQRNKESEQLVFGLPIPRYSELKFGIASKHWMKKYIQQTRPDAIYIATEGPLGYAALRAAKNLGIAAITGFHTNFQSYSKFYSFGFLEPLITRYLRWFHNTSEGTLVPTSQQKEILEKKGFHGIHVVSRGIDSKRFSPSKRCHKLRKSWGANEHDAVFIYVGRIAAEKNLDLLANTYETVSEAYPNAKFVLVGDGPLKPDMSARHPNLIFAGVQRGETLAKYYASGDIFLFPSKTDTFGNVVTEAMASGLCICAFKDAAAKEHLSHRHSGFLADLGDDEQFISNALAALEKPTLRQNIATSSHAISQTLDWKDITQQFCSILENTTNAERGKFYANRTDIRFKPESSSR